MKKIKFWLIRIYYKIIQERMFKLYHPNTKIALGEIIDYGNSHIKYLGNNYFIVTSNSNYDKL